MTISTAQTLGELVAENLDAARVLESHSLDYCCGGERSLADACAAADLDPAVVIADLDSLGPAPAAEWNTMTPGELTDHLVSTHHQYLKAELPRLSELAAKVENAHGQNHGELHDVRSSYETLRYDLEPHLMKEEQILFPMIRELDGANGAPAFHCGSLSNPIGVMHIEHDRAGELLLHLRSITSDYQVPDDGCASYTALYQGLAQLEADTHLHIHKENNVLFPKAVALEAEIS